MPRLILEKEIYLMQDLYFNKGLSIKKIAKRLKLPYGSVYNHTRLVERGFVRPKDYELVLATQQGFTSLHSYSRYLNERRQKMLKYKKLGNLINTKLEELRKTGDWLAKEMEVTKQSISLYRNAICFPEESKLDKLCNALGVERETLEALLKED